MTPAIAVDFDGVLHPCRLGWQGGAIYDDPASGAKEAMTALRAIGFEVIIYSARCWPATIAGVDRPHQRDEIRQWLELHQIPFDRIYDQPGKPHCVLFVDDRAYRFRGNWFAEIGEIIQTAVTQVRIDGGRKVAPSKSMEVETHE